MDIFKLRTDRGNLNAYLTISSPDEGEQVDIDMVKKYLEDSSVVHGVDEDAIREMIEQQQWDRETKVASGEETVPGEDGSVEFYFDAEVDLKPKLKEDGSVDFHDLSMTQNVVKGKHLAKLIEPTKGEPGKDVFGDTIHPREGKPARLVSGKNTGFSKESEDILQADTDGHVKLKYGYRVEVETVFYVNEDVDYSTGDLDVRGDVVVSGDVLSGFRIKATGNVDVRGTVEDSVIEAEGDVLVGGGFLGSGKGWIRAGGNVVLKFVHNQNVSAKSDIYIGEESLHSNLEAGNSIVMNKGKGVLIGGKAKADNSMEIKCVGNDQYVQTYIAVADNAELCDEIENLKAEVSAVDEELDKLIHKILGVINQVYWSGWTSQYRGYCQSYEKRAVNLFGQTNDMIERIDKLDGEIQISSKDAFIKILKCIYPGVRIIIGGVKKKNNDELGSTVFRIKEDELVTTDE